MWRRRYPILIFLGLTAVVISWFAPDIWFVLAIEGACAAMTLASAAGWGAWPAAWLGLRRQPTGKQICLATALGLGWLGVATLVLGAVGILNRPAAWGLLLGGVLLGIVRLYREKKVAETREKNTSIESPAGDPEDRGFQIGALLALILPLALVIFAATLPPGILWDGEGNAYDVLEYHLQGPREYFLAGCIKFLPHNVYTSFPQQMEMLYLLQMHLMGDPYYGAVPSQLLHAACGILAVLAVFFWSPRGASRWIATLLIGTTPWLAYLGCLAYVENGLLFLAAVAAGLILDTFTADEKHIRRLCFAAGLCAGFCGGCKYPALAFVVMGLALAYLPTSRQSFRLRVQNLLLFGAGALLAFSPWLVKNALLTGNPVYPFAYAWFGGKAWSDAQTMQWQIAHGYRNISGSDADRLRQAANELFGGFTRSGLLRSLFGLPLLVFGIAGALLRRSRVTLFLSLWTLLIFAVWTWYTAQAGRFAVPMIIPLALLGGSWPLFRAVEPAISTQQTAARRALRWLLFVVLLIGSGFNIWGLLSRLQVHDDRWMRQAGIKLADLPGQTPLVAEQNTIAQHIPADGYVWMIGDAAVYYLDRRLHYTVAFCRDPWLEFASSHTPAESVNWLREHGVTHVVFSWQEIERLSGTYGFPSLVTDQWVRELETAGLRRIAEVRQPSHRLPTEIYEVQ